MGLALQGGRGIGETYQNRAASPRYRRHFTLVSYSTTAGASMPVGHKKTLQRSRAKAIDSRTNKRKYALSRESIARDFRAHRV